MKELLYKFQGLAPSDAEFEPTLNTMMKHLSEHIKEEEEEDLPKLEKALSDDESEDLARSFDNTKNFVPTRSHPSTPTKPVSCEKQSAATCRHADSLLAFRDRGSSDERTH